MNIFHIMTLYLSSLHSFFPFNSVKDAKSFNNKSLKFGDLLKQCNFIYSDECLTHPEDYFESYNDSIYNQCYRFNSGKNIKGESVPLFSSPIGGKDDSFIMEIYAPSGLVFWVYNYTTPPRRQFKNNHNGDIQFASAGFETHVVVDRTFEFRLGYPYDDCVKNPVSFQLNRTIVDFMISNNVPYSQINCLELCFDMEYLRDNPCNCKNVSLGNVWENCYGKLDNTLNTSECILNHKKAWYQQHLKKTYFDYCPLECDSMFFTVSTRILSNVFNINSTYIQAYYRTLKHTVIEQKPAVNLFDLVAYVGGLTGLFMGCSFMSFFEIIEIINEIIYTLICDLYTVKF